MLIRANGAASGIKEYLEKGQTKDRHYDRDQLDDRQVLTGDLGLVDDIINNYNSAGEKYFHFTLSFKEDSIDNKVLSDITNEFRQFYFKAYNDDEICFYAEAHLPKLKSYKDKSTGELVERKPHIHIVVPKVNLLTGKSLSYHEKYNIAYVNAFQEYINCKYGLESPKDNRRTQFNSKSEMISRYKGDNFIGIGKEDKEKIFHLILDRNLLNSKELHDVLIEQGYQVKVRNANTRDKSYFNILSEGASKGINLKEFVFSEEFLQLSQDDKKNYLYMKNEYKNLTREERLSLIERTRVMSNQYIKAGLSKHVPAKYMDKLQEWEDIVALQRKYIDRDSKKARNEFKKLNFEEKIELLNKQKAHFYNKYGGNDYGINNSELRELVEVYRDVAYENLRAAENICADIAESDPGDKPDIGSIIDEEWLRERRDEYARLVKISEERHIYTGLGHERYESKDRRNSPLDSLTLEYINEKISNGKIKGELAHLKKILKADTLLELTEKLHGVIPEKYKITINKDGQDRILCGDNNYSVVDFCFKELNLPWDKTLQLLRAGELMQREVDRERSWSIHDDQYLFSEYKNWLVQFKASKDVELSNLQAEIKKKYEEIKQKYTIKKDAITNSELGYHKREEQRRVLKMDRIIENRALFAARDKEFDQIKSKYNLDMQESYRKFLIEKAKLGEEKALQELRRLRIDFTEYERSGSIKYVDRYMEFRLNVSHSIDSNGIITYTLERLANDNTLEKVNIIKDIGKRIDILDSDKDNLKLALDLALSKYGRTLELSGKDETKKSLVETAIRFNYAVKFKDDFSKNYQAELIKKMKDSHKALEINNQEFLKKNFTQVHSLLVTDIKQVDTIDDKGKYHEITQVSLFDIKTKTQYELSGSQLAYLDKENKIGVGDMLSIDGGVQNRISVDPYFWSKYTADLKQGVLISDFIQNDKLIIEFPSWRQAKYKDEYFTISQPGIAEKLESIGYLHGDLVSIKPIINLASKEIDYQFSVIGDGPFKAKAKKEILEADIARAKDVFCKNNNLTPDQLSKEITGNVVDFGVGHYNGKESAYISLENNYIKINPEVTKAKEDFCRKHKVSKYNLEKECVGQVLAFGEAKYDKNKPDSPLSYYIKLKTSYGEKVVWAIDLKRVVNEYGIKKNDHIYLANIGKIPIEKKNEKDPDKEMFVYECIKLTEKQKESAKDFTKPLYTRYWNDGFNDIISNNQVSKNQSLYIAKVGENTFSEQYIHKEYFAKKVDLSIIKQELESAKTSIISKNKLPHLPDLSKEYKGEILEHGIGKFNQQSTESYFIKIKNLNGLEQTIWGKDLERLAKEFQIGRGQCIYLTKTHDLDIGSGRALTKYDLRVLDNTTQIWKTFKDDINTAYKNIEINTDKPAFGTIMDIGTKMVKGEEKSFIKLNNIDNKEWTYWDKNLDFSISQFKKGDTIYLNQIYEQPKTREIKQDKFNFTPISNDLEVRAIVILKQRTNYNSKQNEMEQ